jgi:hypothetical protein
LRGKDSGQGDRLTNGLFDAADKEVEIAAIFPADLSRHYFIFVLKKEHHNALFNTV